MKDKIFIALALLLTACGSSSDDAKTVSNENPQVKNSVQQQNTNAVKIQAIKPITPLVTTVVNNSMLPNGAVKLPGKWVLVDSQDQDSTQETYCKEENGECVDASSLSYAEPLTLDEANYIEFLNKDNTIKYSAKSSTGDMVTVSAELSDDFSKVSKFTRTQTTFYGEDKWEIDLGYYDYMHYPKFRKFYFTYHIADRKANGAWGVCELRESMMWECENGGTSFMYGSVPNSLIEKLLNPNNVTDDNIIEFYNYLGF